MSTLLVMARRLTILSALTLFAAMSAYGAAASIIRAKVPFTFEARGKTLPPGEYQVTVGVADRTVLLSGPDNINLRLPLITELSGFSPYRDSGLVFDVSEGRHVLSEIWIPGQNGVLVAATSKQHSHETVIAMIAGVTPNLSGRQIFERTCARCHGAGGEGNPAADKFFKTAVPKLTSASVQSKSDQELRGIISEGKGMMDPVRIGQAKVQHLLSSESVDAVISFVRTLKQP